MLSPLLEGAFQFGGDRFALGAALQLPSLAAAELERKGTFSKEALAEAEHFALTDYLTTLAGPPPQGDAAKAFYARVAEMTGLPQDVVARIARLHPRRLRQESARRRAQDRQPLRRDLRGRRSRSRNRDRRAAPTRSSTASSRAYGSAFVGYARDELGFKTEMTYNLLASDIAGKWDWDGSGRAPPSVTEDLRELLALDAVVPADDRARLQRYGHALCDARYVLDHLPPIGEPASAPSSSSIAAATCSISTRNRARPSPPTPGRSIRRRERSLI